MKSDRYFRIAKEVSKLSDVDRINIGSVIISHNNIVGVGCNSKKTHPLQRRLNKLRFNGINHCHDGQIHSEIQAIINTRGADLSKAELFVYREDKLGKLACCRPCKACMSLIKQKGIKIINYTTKDGYVREVLV